MIRFNLNPSNTLLFFLGLTNDIMSGDNIGTTSIFLLLLKFFSESIFLEKITNNKKEEWLSRVKGDKSFPRQSLLEMIKNHDLSEKNLTNTLEKYIKKETTVF